MSSFNLIFTRVKENKKKNVGYLATNFYSLITKILIMLLLFFENEIKILTVKHFIQTMNCRKTVFLSILSCEYMHTTSHTIEKH